MTLKTPSRILVLGGSGFVGRALCEQLARSGPQVHITVPTRRAAAARKLWPLPNVRAVVTAALNEAALAELVAGADVVVNLIATLHGSQAEFTATHVQLPQRIAKACAAAGVRLIHVSALGVSANAPSRYLRSKAAGEAALQAVPGLALTVLRPSVIYGADDRFTNLFARLGAGLPVLPLAGAQAQLQPVWVQDVARALLACIQQEGSSGQTYELAGPRALSLGEVATLVTTCAGCDTRVWPLPQALAWMQASVMELVPGKPLLTRDNLLSLAVPNVASGKLPGLMALGVQPAALEDVLPFYLGAAARNPKFNEFRARRG